MRYVIQSLRPEASPGWRWLYARPRLKPVPSGPHYRLPKKSHRQHEHGREYCLDSHARSSPPPDQRILAIESGRHNAEQRRLNPERDGRDHSWLSRIMGSITFVLRSTASTTVRCSTPSPLLATMGST